MHKSRRIFRLDRFVSCLFLRQKDPRSISIVRYFRLVRLWKNEWKHNNDGNLWHEEIL